MSGDTYSHGHHESVLRSHRWRTVANSAGFLVPRLHRGQSVLDVGCGPGNITAELAELVAPGRVVGIDLSAEIVEAAARSHEGVNLEFAVGDVYDLAVGDGDFDVVYAHQVLQHLSDPVAALREMRRVVADDGVVAVRDSDYGAFVWAPADERLTRWMTLYHELVARNSAEADAGRVLHVWARAAGFAEIEVSSSTWTFHTPEERAWWGGLWADRVRHSEFARQAVAYGLSDDRELQTIAEGFLDWAEHPDGLFLLVHGEVLCRG